MSKQVIVIFLFPIMSLAVKGPVFSWNDDITHKLITEYAAEESGLSQGNGNYLKQLGFQNGIKQLLRSGMKIKYAKNWITEGAHLEDAGNLWQQLNGTARFYNHFHNPLKFWDTAGLDDYVIFAFKIRLLHVAGISSLLWAQDSSEQDRPEVPEGDRSWQANIEPCIWRHLLLQTMQKGRLTLQTC